MSVGMAAALAGCGFAQYTKVRVRVLDGNTTNAIVGARLSVFYMKPMLDPSHQHHDHKKTDSEGYATLTVATNQSQWTIFGWTHGIFPQVKSEAKGYYDFEGGFSERDYSRKEPVIIRMEKRNGSTNHVGATSGWEAPTGYILNSGPK